MEDLRNKPERQISEALRHRANVRRDVGGLEAGPAGNDQALTLPDVTLIVIDNVAHDLARLAIEDTLKQVTPAEVLQWTDLPGKAHPSAKAMPMGGARSMGAYERTLWQEAPSQIRTSHVLTVQWDGWVLNGDCWDDLFLQYDYVGAPWWWHPDKRVGNGGFSLRSIGLMRFLAANADRFPIASPEDDTLCRRYRSALEAEGFRWAPEPVAARFSFECSKPAAHPTFGFHDMRNWPRLLDDAALDRRMGLINDYVRGKGLIPAMLANRGRTPQGDEPERLMAAALLVHRQGQLAQAESLYRQVLGAAPRHAEALHMLGVIALQQRRIDEADRLIAEALAIDPDNPEALNSRGTVLRALGRLDDALACYDRALARRPAFAETLHNRGNVLRDLGRLEEAVASYDEAMALRPDHAALLHSRGNLLQKLRRLEEALASYDRALVISPEHAEVLYDRGNVLQGLGRPEEALASYDRALALRPEHAEALNNRAAALLRLGRPAEALTSCEKALAASPDYDAALNNRAIALWQLGRLEEAEALCGRGTALERLGRLEEALASYDRVLAIRPDYPEALSKRAHTLLRLGRPVEALTSCDRALALRPDFAEALNNRAIACQRLGRLEEALAGYAAATAVRPDFADAHWNEALCRLSVGDFAIGWEKYEWRWRLKLPATAKRHFGGSLWLGKEKLAGKTVLLHAEQGLGDTLQFCRYAPAVAALGATVILDAPAPLKSLLRTLPGIERVVDKDDPPQSFDFHCPLMSLPLAFSTRVETIPAPVPYLWANPFRAAAWDERLAKFGGLKVGLVWAGSGKFEIPGRPRPTAERHRSLRLEQMSPFGVIEGVTLVSLQKGEPASQTRTPPPGLAIHDWTDELTDFADTAALVAALDLVISVDTAVAHLAGALGKKVWLLLHDSPDWRWLLDREDTPWYPTVRLFAQPALGDWDSVVRRVSGELRNFVNDRLRAPAGKTPGLAPTSESDDVPSRAAELTARSARRPPLLTAARPPRPLPVPPLPWPPPHFEGTPR
jgi:tetratricopeptide (TPR) repeat protein